MSYSSKKSISMSGAPTIVSSFPNSVVTFVKGPFWEWLLSRSVTQVEGGREDGKGGQREREEVGEGKNWMGACRKAAECRCSN